MNKIRLFLTLTGYQLTWLACVFGESIFFNPVLGIYVGVIFLILYFYFNNHKIKYIKTSLAIAIPGYLFDTLMVYFHIYEFNTNATFGTLPYWMIFLWLSFSTLFDEILVFFKKFKLLGIAISSIIGPITYYLGKPIGVISISNEILFVSLMVLFWSILMIYYLEVILKKN